MERGEVSANIYFMTACVEVERVNTLQHELSTSPVKIGDSISLNQTTSLSFLAWPSANVNYYQGKYVLEVGVSR